MRICKLIISIFFPIILIGQSPTVSLTDTDSDNILLVTDTVKIIATFSEAITNFFSPNGGGNGDTWQIKEVERYPKSRVWIFTRTGKKIFSANPYLNNWNGEFNGSPLPVGSYYYRLDLDGNNNIDFEGWVYLHR
jgi:gliding motility-associated-like protein